ncbi:hypothetical protein [Paenibacillus sp. 481]|nr:hypothetical protein [Paenibacillus sp. 481]UHA74318.1 hypothetical protein KIK04_04085 [Paenibacillus sp. 481]
MRQSLQQLSVQYGQVASAQSFREAIAMAGVETVQEQNSRREGWKGQART